VRIEIPAEFFLLGRFQLACRFAAAMECPVGSRALIVAVLRGALSKAAQIDDVAHRNYQLFNEQPPCCGYSAEPFGPTGEGMSDAKVFPAFLQYTLR
jgi:hypothetical protein